MKRNWTLFTLGALITFASGFTLHLYAEHIQERYRDALPNTQLQASEFHIFQGLAVLGLIGLVIFSIGGISLIWQARYSIWDVLKGG